VSVTSGFRCVDFRKWFMPYGQTEIRPTRSGIALCLCKWGEIQKLVETINTAYPVLIYAFRLCPQGITQVCVLYWGLFRA